MIKILLFLGMPFLGNNLRKNEGKRKSRKELWQNE
jgi:hypothetical protein